jgi:hypothetical protein
MDIHANVNVLTREIKFVTFIHGKPPLGIFLFGKTKYTMQGRDLPFTFLIIRSAKAGIPGICTSVIARSEAAWQSCPSAILTRRKTQDATLALTFHS